MRPKMLNSLLRTAAFAGFLLTAGVSSAATDVYLQAQSFQKDVGDGVMVDMWGFASCDSTFTTCVLDAPGTPITIDTSVSANLPLNIHLSNTLSTPVSIVIPGQAGGGNPVRDAGGRVQSFTTEIAAGADTGATPYTWSSLRPGTYLYQSGTHPSLQVPMGLYGALAVVDGVYPGAGYDSDAVMLFSEIDPIQNGRVAAAAGTPTQACVSMADHLGGMVGYPCTIDYNPMYFLVNGEAAPNLTGFVAGNNVLLRLLNAGLRTHTPALVGVEMTLYAEDGNLYPGLPLQQSEALLPAGKTLDALVSLPATPNLTLALLDRSPSFSDGNQPTGGAWATVQVGDGTPAPPDPTTYAVNDTYAVPEDCGLDPTCSSPWLAPQSVLFNDVMLLGATVSAVSQPSNGTLNLNTDDGTFDYTPNENFSGVDGFTYSATLAGNSYPAQVTLNVSFVNDGPVAADDAYVGNVGGSITVAAPGVLGNDADADGDSLTAVFDAGAGVTLDADGSFTYTGPSATFTYNVSDDGGTTTSDTGTVTLTVNPASNIALNVWEAVPVGTDPTVAITAYRWLVQEDATFNPDPNNPPTAGERLDATQSLNFHQSYMPIVAQGCVGMTTPCLDQVDGEVADIPFTMAALDATKHYYVSVLPNDAGTSEGHTIGGAQIPPGTAAVTVFVNSQEIPTSQLNVFVFDDTSPTNGFPDGNEAGLGGFQITLEDAGGRYGISGGTMSQDALGNPLKNSLDCAPPATAGVIVTCPDGRALIQDLPPAKYGVIATAPLGQEGIWTQTATIEGSKVIDAWVEAGNPPMLVEFGIVTPHAFIGFVNPSALVNPGGDNSITGKVTLLHDPRPPALIGSVDSDSYVGFSHTRAWVGLNSTAGDGDNIATVHADSEGNFTLDGVPNGTHQLVIWDDYLNQIIAYRTVILSGAGADVGNVAINAWFNRFENNVYLDDGCGNPLLAGNGIRDDCGGGNLEAPLSEQAINLRWRDGTVNQSFPTDLDGFLPFDSVFPFFSWQIVEVDYTRFKATGLTVTVDAGGDVSGDGGIPDRDYTGLLNPQVQPGGGLTRTEAGPVLTQAYQGFAGQTSIFDWGKAPYEPGENGGISGIVFYGSTRGENDPRLTVGDPWEPGIPSVKLRLYREIARDPLLVDQDNVPLHSALTPFPGVDDVDHNGNGIFDGPTTLALLEEGTTDSWDDSMPTGCVGEDPGSDFAVSVLDGDDTRCFDGMRNWNQARPGVFDGGYAFGATEADRLPPGKYVVEVELPPGYELIKEEDVNVGFGDTFGPNAGTGFAPVSVTLPNGMLALLIPDQAMVEAAMGAEPGIAQPPCVGQYHTVPAELSLFPGMEAPFADAARPLCDRKAVNLSDQGQAAADFHLFTSTPVAAQFSGLTLDDLTNESDTSSPNYGEKWGAGNMPIAIRDFNGRQVYRGYTDPYGRFSGVMPSTFTANVPIPSGYSPAMYFTCMNDAGDEAIPDPLRVPRYGAACYTLQYMPGTTTYVDTPIIPTAAFAGGYNSADCAAPQGTPVIASVGDDTAGTFGPLVAPGNTIIINSAGNEVVVPNPAYEGPLGTQPPTITRNFGFGAGGGPNRGTVELVESDGTRTTLVTLNGGQGWTPNTIRAIAPATAMTGTLVVTRGDGANEGNASVNAVTVTVGTETPIRVPGDYATIQDAIDDAAPGSLILVESGAYMEQVIMWKPVRLQGSGTETLINAIKQPAQTLTVWMDKVNGLVGDGTVDLLPGQDPTFANELGAGVTVLAKNDESFANNPARIDGFTIINANIAGGIFVNGYATNLEISNTQITGNSGSLHGGIRVGHAFLPNLVPNGDGLFAFNDNLNIHHNAITLNGGVGFQSVGGGLSLNTGTDNYTVSDNFICGNLSMGDGAGIGHLGLSNDGLIEGNQILFNQSFNPDRNPSGGGIFIGGEPAGGGALTLGSGNVTVDANRIQANEAGSGHGAGIRTQFVNGADATGTSWAVEITNNMIVNNVTGYSGAGISLQDTVNASIINNTIANNDSTATEGSLLTAGSTPQPAGISSARHSPALAAALGVEDGFSSPVSFVNNIVWHNRAFSWDGAVLQPVLVQNDVGACDSSANYWDLGVLGEPQVPAAGDLKLDPQQSILTTLAGGYSTTNLTGDPDLLDEYCNGARTLSTPWGPMGSTAAFGEGGNFVNVRWGPLTQAWPANTDPWDYHIGAGSAGLNNGNATFVDFDFDNDGRPQQLLWDRGADELVGGECSDNSDNAGAACLVDNDCPPNGGNPTTRGTCVLP